MVSITELIQSILGSLAFEVDCRKLPSGFRSEYKEQGSKSCKSMIVRRGIELIEFTSFKELLRTPKLMFRMFFFSALINIAPRFYSDPAIRVSFKIFSVYRSKYFPISSKTRITSD